jgi:hypothetical protein
MQRDRVKRGVSAWRWHFELSPFLCVVNKCPLRNCIEHLAVYKVPVCLVLRQGTAPRELPLQERRQCLAPEK